ncbi:class I SAM-dependent methyltransferase family protein [uncultured Methanomethylovorans sp.]|uniref:class I SAM-dependent methyltransferase n=1 Tax=uncultured Methanomethylovorans sp. TaxID=183759 RepID=UPI002AA8C9B3|nr:class I SAM-dependent methyltransferase family protein [uncultured Methanomethylovorans sp.]
MKQQCIQVDKKKGESVRKVLMENGALDTSVRIVSDESYIYIPLISAVDLKDLLFEDLQVTEHDFKVHEKPATLESILGHIPRYEVIGNIALLESDEGDLETTAAALLKVQPHLHTVLSALSPVEGEFRTRRFTFVKGENTTQTVHREYSCKYAIDMEKAYFTPRLATERSRILEQVKDGEVIVDMFAGVGPFSILIAKGRPSCRVVAIDKNPEAVKFLRHNIELNAVSNVEAVEGDAKEEAQRYIGVADHIIMNLPHTAQEFLGAAIVIAKPGTVIHYYDITPESDLYSTSLGHIESAASKAGFAVELIGTRIVRSYSPHQFNVCIEVKLY